MVALLLEFIDGNFEFPPTKEFDEYVAVDDEVAIGLFKLVGIRPGGGVVEADIPPTAGVGLKFVGTNTLAVALISPNGFNSSKLFPETNRF